MRLGGEFVALPILNELCIYGDCSQPPLLSEMVKEVFAATNNTAFLAEAFAALEAEHSFWTQAPVQVTVQSGGRSYQLARYWSSLYSPRPESYAYALSRPLAR